MRSTFFCEYNSKVVYMIPKLFQPVVNPISKFPALMYSTLIFESYDWLKDFNSQSECVKE